MGKENFCKYISMFTEYINKWRLSGSRRILHEQPTLNTAKSQGLQVWIWKSTLSKWEGQNLKHVNHKWKAAHECYASYYVTFELSNGLLYRSYNGCGESKWIQQISANFRWMQTCLLASVPAEVLWELKIIGPRSNLYLRQNRTPIHSQKKKNRIV